MEELDQILWRQFGASINMLKNAIAACPAEYWDDEKKFWYTAYHTLFYLDYYLDEEPTTFHPPAPFTLSEMDPAGLMPERIYTQEELLQYLDHCLAKCRGRATALTGRDLYKPVITHNKNYPAAEMMIYNLRHVQHHVGQLNLQLRQFGVDVPGWVSRAE